VIRRPYGSWPSAITAELVVSASTRLGQLVTDGTAVLWTELRPDEGGRTQILRRDPTGAVSELLPPGFSAASRVHEYGGGAVWFDAGTPVFVNDADQRIWRIPADGQPVPVTPEVPDRQKRYADGVSHPAGWTIVVEEDHTGEGEAVNRLVAVPSEGGEPVAIYEGSDFVAGPRLSLDGALLAFLTWDHPDMPFDATTLCVAPIRLEGQGLRLGEVRAVAGGPGEAICQPTWDASGRLWFISDRTEWWNLYRFDEPGLPAGDPVAVRPVAAEVGEPAWILGQSRYAHLSDGRVVAAEHADGRDRLAVIDEPAGRVDLIDSEITEISHLVATATTAVLIGASPRAEPSVRAFLVGRQGRASAPVMLRAARDLPVSSEHLSVGEHLTFPTDDGEIAHAIYYPPTNPDVEPLPGELPPLIVMIHGGPTSRARNELRLPVQFWTNRGFAVVDVDHRGSTGYGRSYRHQLWGRWGEADVADCVAAAMALAGSGRADLHRMLIRGASAGGFTTLAALTFTEVFAAGASYYGIGDLSVLAADTHKFESRYLDRLVGPWPDAAELYRSRSPLEHLDRLNRPVILFQGTEDRVVPQNQADAIAEGLAARGVPHAYLRFEGEGHGFRRAVNLRRALEAEWSFYLQVLGIEHPPDLPRVELR
jgi:dipeptidyl aminopeptidase/acylaminoacyl peptidase